MIALIVTATGWVSDDYIDCVSIALIVTATGWVSVDLFSAILLCTQTHCALQDYDVDEIYTMLLTPSEASTSLVGDCCGVSCTHT